MTARPRFIGRSRPSGLLTCLPVPQYPPGHMQVLLISTYELGHQPFGLASATAWLRRAGFQVACVDASLDPVEDRALASAAVVGVSLSMHTATRLAMPLIRRIRRVNPGCRLCCFGLYAPLNEALLRAEGVDVGPWARVRSGLGRSGAVAAGQGLRACQGRRARDSHPSPRLHPPRPVPAATARPLCPPSYRRRVPRRRLHRGVARLQAPLPSLSRSSRCTSGDFRLVPRTSCWRTCAQQVDAGAQHLTFGDPDFFNGRTHATSVIASSPRRSLASPTTSPSRWSTWCGTSPAPAELRGPAACSSRAPSRRSTIECSAATGKGHTRADFEAGGRRLPGRPALSLSPTFVAFTPWTSFPWRISSSRSHRSPRARASMSRPSNWRSGSSSPTGRFCSAWTTLRRAPGAVRPRALVYPWTSQKPDVDVLQDEVRRWLARGRARRARKCSTRSAVAARHAGVGRSSSFAPSANLEVCATPGHTAPARENTAPTRASATVPYLEEPWYC